jgi:L-ascorbate metabolism protein UlaG (beta-lactamase superfamily)
MRLRRMGWAGVEVEADGASVVIDLVVDLNSVWTFNPQGPMLKPDDDRACAALMTHMHRDHADGIGVRDALGPDGILLRPDPPDEQEFTVAGSTDAEAVLDAVKLDTHYLSHGDSLNVGPFTITATFASDGLGDPQVNWVVRAGERAIFHGGDTMWHGKWWEIARRWGPIDAACLPANGVYVDYPDRAPSVNMPLAMTPEQAVEACRALDSPVLVPIHYGTFSVPPVYTPTTNVPERLADAAYGRGVRVDFSGLGEWIELAAVTSDQQGHQPRSGAR